MISIDDWSDLITVNYVGGMGGDFFSFLVDSCLREDNPSFNHNEKFKYEFYDDDAFNLQFKSLHGYFNKVENKPNIKELDSINNIFNLHSQIYVEGDVDKTAYNIRKMAFKRFSHKFFRKRVYSFHFIDSYGITPQQIFPKSSNIFLSTDNKIYELFTKFLFMYKMALDVTKIIDGKPTISYKFSTVQFNSIEAMIDKIICGTGHDKYDELFIDMKKLILEDYNYDKLLSDYCNTKIVLDTERIKNYRNQNLQILNKYGIDIYKDYNESVLRSLILDAVAVILREKSNV
jgi:hypothetical protein